MSFFASKPNNGNSGNNGSPQTVDINTIVENAERNFISQAELTKLGGIEANANKTTLVDNLTSTSTTTALTANQGRVLNASITTHSGDTVKHITSAERTAWNAKSDFSGSYNDLTNKPNIPTPTTVENILTSTSTTSALSSNQGRVLNTNITNHINDVVKHVTDAERTSWNAKSNFSGSYTDLTNKPTIPSATTIVNNLTSTSTTSALSASQGKVLNDKIVALKINEAQFEVSIDTEGTTTITVPKANYNENNVMLVFNGESKVAKSKYTVSNTASEVTITFTDALTVGDVIEVIFLAL